MKLKRPLRFVINARMTLLVSPAFWFFAICAGAFLRLFNASSHRQIAFGLINLGLLFYFFGKNTVIGLALFSSFFVLLLRFSQSKSIPRYWVCVVTLTSLFIVYKLILSRSLPSSFSTETRVYDLAKIAALLPFSYVYLRSIDAFNSLKGRDFSLKDVNPLTLSAYLLPVHMFYAGPIAPYKKFVEGFRHDPEVMTLRSALATINLAATGFFYKFFCAEAVRWIAFGNQKMMSTHLTDTISIFVYTFFDFAGYSCMAIALGRLLGIYTPANFDRPFMAGSVTDFYNRWHMSLGDFIRRNIYFPLQMALFRNAPSIAKSGSGFLFANCLILVLAFLFVGAWHGFKPEFLKWGLVLGGVIGAEKLVIDFSMKHQLAKKRAIRIFWTCVGPVYTLLMVSTLIHQAMNLMINHEK